MELFYLTDLPDYVMEILAEEDDPILVSQDLDSVLFTKVKDKIPNFINDLCKQGKVAVLATQNVVILLRRKTAWVCDFDTKTRKGTSGKEIIAAYKEGIDLIKQQTQYCKCETRTPLEKYAKVMAKALHANVEGVCKKSYRTSEGKMIDEYIVGLVIERGPLCL